MYRILTVMFLLWGGSLASQPVLPGNIGLNNMPSDNDSICHIPWYLGSFYTSGLQAGDTAYNFTLYDLLGDSLNLQQTLGNGRPVLLIAGSYTCPVYRNRVATINDIVNTYSGLMDVYIIYTLEAHPLIDTSVYFGYVNTGTPNMQSGILYRQPTTYGERKLIVADMLDSMPTLAPVFIDGPCNNWWNNFGPAPNNAYLIDTTGIIFSKHGWFDRFPDNIYCDIDSLLGTSSGNCNATGGTSQYIFQYTSDDTIFDVAGNTISVDAELTNTGSQDILIYARKTINDMPQGWASSICIDVCYATNIDSVVFLLPAGVTQPVHIYFYTSPSTSDTGYVRLGFKNLSDTTNKNIMHSFGISTVPTSIGNAQSDEIVFTITPNPVNSELTFNISPFINFNVEIYNTLGAKVWQSQNTCFIDVSNFPSGIYYLKLNGTVKKFLKK